MEPHSRAAALQAIGNKELEAMRGQSAAQQEAMRQAGAMQRTNVTEAGSTSRAAMAVAGSTGRASMAEHGANHRAGGELALGLGRLSLDQNRAASEDRLRGPQIQAAERLGKMQDAYFAATTGADRAAIAAQIRAYYGKDSDSWKAVALQGGTDAMGNKTESMLGAVNERTGEMRRMDNGQKPAPLPNHVEYLKKNPHYAQQFDMTYGQGAAKRVLGS